MKKSSKIMILFALALLGCMLLATTAFASEGLDGVVNPVVSLINSLTKPVLAIVGALGSLYCILLGVKYAKAEEPQDREKAKTHLKNAIIGFVLIFVLILALNKLMPALINWVNSNAGSQVIS